jgi:hypothetical protein
MSLKGPNKLVQVIVQLQLPVLVQNEVRKMHLTAHEIVIMSI